MLALAFYKADSVGSDGNGHMMDKAIGLWTRGPYSHTELVLSGPDIYGNSYCFSSSPRDNGTRFKHICLSDGKWDVVQLPETDGNDGEVWKWCLDHKGLPYDLAGVFGFVCWPFVRQDPKRWFCSESCVAALQTIGMLPGVSAWRVSPNRLYKMVRGEE